MVSSTAEIANMAISFLGIGKDIANLDSENSAEAKACRRFYENDRDIVLGDFPWPFATVFADLALVETDPTDEWGFSYRYPSDAVRIRRILSGVRNDTQDSRIRFRKGKDSAGILIYTDQADAVIEYTQLVTAVELYSPDFVKALAYLLASSVASRLTAGDPYKFQTRCMQFYKEQIASAQIGEVEEEQPDVPVESEFIRSRE